MKKLFSFIFTSLFALNGYGITQPKLIVQIVIDQLRGDLIRQHQSQFGTKGFNYLLQHSLDYNNAHHPHANTATCVGHATIATGSYPSYHGIIANDWYDPVTKRLTYCAEDLTVETLPTRFTKIKNPGRSPANLKASTLSDEIILAKKGKAFAVSLKDRSAITLAGHAGKAFWFDKTNGGFVTTNYYYELYPDWATAWNKNYVPNDFVWNLSHPKNDYRNVNFPIITQNDKEFGDRFPHAIKNAPSPRYFNNLSETPKADQLTADFAESLLTHEQLGKSENKTDYLGISFSVNDVIAHHFGPNSLEAEDNLLVLDKTLAHLLDVIDKQVGLEHTLIILSADHGTSDGAAYLKAHHMPVVETIDMNALQNNIVNVLKAQYQLPEQALEKVEFPFVYLNHDLIEAHHLGLIKVSKTVVEILDQQPGVFKAYPLPVVSYEKNWLTKKVERMAYNKRAGDIYIVTPANYEFFRNTHEVKVSHGSPWQYDSYVPLLVSNPAFKPQVISRPVYTTDIAITLSSLLGIKPTSASVGKPLLEVLAYY